MSLAPDAYLGLFLLLQWLAGGLFKFAVVDSPEVGVLEVDLLQVGGKDIHLGAIGQDASVVQVLAGQPRAFAALHFHEGLPDFGFLEDEYTLDLPIVGKELVEDVVGEQVSRFVVDANEQYRRNALLVLLLHFPTNIMACCSLHLRSIFPNPVSCIPHNR